MLNSNMTMKTVYGLKIFVDHTLNAWQKYPGQKDPTPCIEIYEGLKLEFYLTS